MTFIFGMEIANTKTIVPLWEAPMFRNYLEIALRSFARHKPTASSTSLDWRSG
jgi:hypothetical protein